MYDSPESELLFLLADRAGIAADYHDIAGTRHVTTDETRRAILSAMGFSVADRSALIESLTAWDHRWWLQGCEPVSVVRIGQALGEWALHVPCEPSDDACLHVEWMLHDEQGKNRYERQEGPGLRIHEARVIQNRRYVRLAFALPGDLAIGYYRATVRDRKSTRLNSSH